ncbi:hypothetical protein TNCV_279671 [Trichonephila clavipes]|nr:hypothetical protein TNCV_279671 [Trichonephila clavipes]
MPRYQKDWLTSCKLVWNLIEERNDEPSRRGRVKGDRWCLPQPHLEETEVFRSSLWDVDRRHHLKKRTRRYDL